MILKLLALTNSWSWRDAQLVLLSPKRVHMPTIEGGTRTSRPACGLLQVTLPSSFNAVTGLQFNMSTSVQAQAAVHDERFVQRVRVVAHTLGPAGLNTSDNHWSIYLLLANNASIRVNMAAEPGYINGELRLTSQNYQLTNSAITHFDYQVLGTRRVADFLRTIYQNRRHVYEMSGGGSGCRYWMQVYVLIV